ncbi:hypothetical protein BGZ95_002814, partial [Linnemannia exigua]
MANLLFQNGKATSSSSASASSSSSSANPFQALAHFYEQELSDLHVDCRLQQQEQAEPRPKSSSHLFPSSSVPTASDTWPSASPQDEFRIFSQRPSATPKWDPHASSHLHSTSIERGQRQADVDEYLKHRQDYYAREARIRSQDRHDGLGPIIDFSVPRSHGHSDRHHHHPHTDSSLESRGSRGTSQLEQVWMDLGPESVPAQLNDHTSTDSTLFQDMESAWSRYSEGTTSWKASTTASGSLQAVFPRLGASNFRQAAASLHSSWPMAPWAIEAEAALMEVETIHHQHPGTVNHTSNVYQTPAIHLQTTAPESQYPSWVQEFSHDDSIVNTGTSNFSASAGKDQEQTRKDIHGTRRISTVMTCGFILEAKNHQDTTDPFLGPDATNYKMMDILSQQDIQSTQTTIISDTLALEQQSTSHPTTTYDSILNQPFPLPRLRDLDENPKEQPGQVFNDDLFEGDMLQAWMDTLAQEKQEANEQVQEQEQVTVEMTGGHLVKQEVADQVVLEVALRRLNVLMRQLGRTQ